MRSLILFILAVFMTACSTTSKNFPAIKPAVKIQKGDEIPLGQELEGSAPRKTIAGGIFDGDLWFYKTLTDCVLDWRGNASLYKDATIMTLSTVLPEYGGATGIEVFEEGLIKLFWGKDGKMHAQFLPPLKSQMRKLRG